MTETQELKARLDKANALLARCCTQLNSTRSVLSVYGNATDLRLIPEASAQRMQEEATACDTLYKEIPFYGV